MRLLQLACVLAIAGAVMNATAANPTLDHVGFGVTTVGGGSFSPQGSCSTGTFSFQASGLVGFGPLTPTGSTFTEMGSFTVAPGMVQGTFVLTAFQASFSFPTTNPPGQATGTKSLTPGSQVIVWSCDATAVQLVANTGYQAQIVTQNGTFNDQGTAQTGLLYTFTGTPIRTFTEDFTSMGASGPPACVTPPPGMVSWWPGDGNTNDIQGGNNGTWIGTAGYAPGEVGNAFSLNGSSFITVGNPPSLNITGNQVTLDGWINPSAINNDVVYFGKQAYGANDYALIFQFNRVTAMMKTNTMGEVILLSGFPGFVPPTNQWTHLAFTYDGTAMNLYVNGALMSTQAANGNLLADSPEFAIGGRSFDCCGRHFYFTGQIDEVEVFNRALSAAEIQAIFNAGAAGKCKPTVVTNQPPVASCQSQTVVTAPNSCQVPNVSINAGSSDPDGDMLMLSQTPPGPYGLGMTLVTLTATDPGGLSSQCQATVTVQDKTPPAVGSASANPNVLWPPNHKMVPVTVSASASDNCGSAACKIVSVSSNEPLDADGDWVITGPLTLNLRADRLGQGSGRVYTITIACTDGSGNTAMKTVMVSVPHDQGQ